MSAASPRPWSVAGERSDMGWYTRIVDANGDPVFTIMNPNISGSDPRRAEIRAREDANIDAMLNAVNTSGGTA